jgi:hypothetical protein
MAAKYYAWAPIDLGDTTIEAGSVVTSKQIGDDWNALVSCRAIRTKVYPDMPSTWKGSVRSFRMEQVRAMRAGLDANDLLASAVEVEPEQADDEYLELLAEVEGADG